MGLVNVGTEDSKGGELQHEAFALLKDSGLHFVGNIEARDIPHNAADVVVADGFTGNVILKMMEGVAEVIMGNLKDIFMSSLKTKIAALMIKPGLRMFKKKMDTSEYGVTKPVIKAHGNSNAKAFKNAIRVAAEFSRAGVIEEIAASVKKNETAPADAGD